MMEKLDSKSEEFLSLVSGGRLTDEAMGWVQRNMNALMSQRPSWSESLSMELMQLMEDDDTHDLHFIKTILHRVGYNLSGLN